MTYGPPQPGWTPGPQPNYPQQQPGYPQTPAPQGQPGYPAPNPMAGPYGPPALYGRPRPAGPPTPLIAGVGALLAASLTALIPTLIILTASGHIDAGYLPGIIVIPALGTILLLIGGILLFNRKIAGRILVILALATNILALAIQVVAGDYWDFQSIGRWVYSLIWYGYRDYFQIIALVALIAELAALVLSLFRMRTPTAGPSLAYPQQPGFAPPQGFSPPRQPGYPQPPQQPGYPQQPPGP
ncbi:MAG TPA: hypothetical protein VG317_12170 [Pseudonocardiaceae bacterium]|jgi:hypothetical protein|nr:hypothetical protein [Pseudonocardiaceae bacterium]